MQQPLAYFGILTLALGLTGCAGLKPDTEFVETEIVAFHQVDSIPKTTTFAFEPLVGQEGILEYAAYREIMGPELARHGFQEVSAGANPDVVVSFAYSIDGGGDDVIGCVPVVGRGGFLMPMTDVADNRLRGAGVEPGVAAYTPLCDPADSAGAPQTQYTRELMVYIIDFASLDQRPLKVIYEGNAKSRGSSSQLASVMPGMIEALFRDFPGENGVVRIERISLRPESEPEPPVAAEQTPEEAGG